jgi:hypothetical protein
LNGVKKLLREYNLLSAAVTATIAFAMLMGWISLTEDQMAGLLALVAAWFAVLRFLVTPVASAVLPAGTVVRSPTGTRTVIE